MENLDRRQSQPITADGLLFAAGHAYESATGRTKKTLESLIFRHASYEGWTYRQTLKVRAMVGKARRAAGQADVWVTIQWPSVDWWKDTSTKAQTRRAEAKARKQWIKTEPRDLHIQGLAMEGWTQKRIAALFNLTQGAVSKILKRLREGVQTGIYREDTAATKARYLKRKARLQAALQDAKNDIPMPISERGLAPLPDPGMSTFEGIWWSICRWLEGPAGHFATSSDILEMMRNVNERHRKERDREIVEMHRRFMADRRRRNL